MDTNTLFGHSSTEWDAHDWSDWKSEVERRIIAIERSLREATLAEALEEYATTGTVTTPIVTTPTEPATQVLTAGDGSVTVSLTPVTGGVFGVAPSPSPRGDGAAYEGTTAHRAEAAAAAMSTPTKSARKRAPRVSPTDAKLRVQQALTSAQSTIRGITAWEVANGWGTPLTTSQVRAALTSLEQEGKVYVAGKRGKQEVWSLRP